MENTHEEASPVDETAKGQRGVFGREARTRLHRLLTSPGTEPEEPPAQLAG